MASCISCSEVDEYRFHILVLLGFHFSRSLLGNFFLHPMCSPFFIQNAVVISLGPLIFLCIFYIFIPL